MIRIDPLLKQEFEGLEVQAWRVDGVKVLERDERLEQLKRRVEAEIRGRLTLEQVKDHPVFRAYRDFYWRLGIDPTKDRPAGEALVRRILSGRPLPTINTAVDCYNLASAETGVAMGAYDASKLSGELVLRKAKPGEEFLGIGFTEAVRLRGGEPVISDGQRLIAIYPYRDSDITKITLETTSILLLSCGVPGLDLNLARLAGEKAVSYLRQFCIK
ncbi:MAG: phenylalanine--tRNA ligase beta subunit-related protein [Candidatus Hadarchaeales archaeon]